MFRDITVDRPVQQRTRSTHSACQRCHLNKKKCIFANSRVSCSSCCLLGARCYPRQWKRMGRRPATAQIPHERGSYTVLCLSTRRESSCSSQAPVCTQQNEFQPPLPALNIRVLKCLTECDQKLRDVLWTREGFSNVHRPFLVGESFADEFHTTIMFLIERSTSTLVDGYRAVLELMERKREQDTSAESLDVTPGTSCLRSFIELSYSPGSVEHAAVVLMLGQILLAYNALLWIGTTRTIAQGTLIATRNQYSALLCRPEFDCVTITPVLIDTIDCLIRREVPILRLPQTDRCIVDRTCGICYTLLPILYDLCQASHEAKTCAFDVPGQVFCDPYAEVERQINAWYPVCPPSFAKYSSTETAVMWSMARSYRLAALLIIHRLRYPLGIEDKCGARYAQAILDEVVPLSRLRTSIGLDFPLLVATIELPVLGAAVSKAFQPLRYCKRQLDAILDFVQRVREAQAAGFVGLWFDLVESEYEGDILP